MPEGPSGFFPNSDPLPEGVGREPSPPHPPTTSDSCRCSRVRPARGCGQEGGSPCQPAAVGVGSVWVGGPEAGVSRTSEIVLLQVRETKGRAAQTQGKQLRPGVNKVGVKEAGRRQTWLPGVDPLMSPPAPSRLTKA